MPSDLGRPCCCTLPHPLPSAGGKPETQPTSPATKHPGSSTPGPQLPSCCTPPHLDLPQQPDVACPHHKHIVPVRTLHGLETCGKEGGHPCCRSPWLHATPGTGAAAAQRLTCQCTRLSAGTRKGKEAAAAAAKVHKAHAPTPRPTCRYTRLSAGTTATRVMRATLCSCELLSWPKMGRSSRKAAICRKSCSRA